MDPPISFDFPFEPYPIQLKFMKELYSTLNENKLGIFESPTGTGKSLSICCGAITWLKDYEASIINKLESNIKQLKIDIGNVRIDGDWLLEEHEKIQINFEINKLTKQLDNINKQNDKLNKLKLGVARQQLLSGNNDNKFWRQKDVSSKTDKSDADEGCEKTELVNENQEDDLLLVESEECEVDNDDFGKVEEKSDENNQVQIYYGSRTHSQLSQFLSEIKRSKHSDIRAVTLASRRHYCINPDVQKLKNLHLMDERCMELRKSKQSSTTLKDGDDNIIKKQKKKSASSCPYYNQSGIEILRDIALGEISDIEEITNIGKLAKGCPYYAVRAAAKDAQVVLLPHTSILTNLEISKETVLILDEAHNLGGALSSAYTVNVHLPVLTNGKTALSSYISKYKDKFAPKTLLKLNQITFIISKLIGILQLKSQQKSEIYMQSDFMIQAQIDHLNISPLVKFCYDSKLSQKLHWFCIKHNSSNETKHIEKNISDNLKKFLTSMSEASKPKNNFIKHTVETVVEENDRDENSIYSGSPIYKLLRFLDLISTSTEDSRICIQRDMNPCLKYLLLDPTKKLSSITQTAKSIILAGGTMQPDWEFSRLLLSGGDSENRLHKVSCDHVVDPEHIKPVILHSGPGEKKIKLTHATRNNTDVLKEVGRVIQNLCRIVPGGIICFLSSYGYEEIFFNHLQETGVLAQISKLKTVFREPKESKDIDKLLGDYQNAIKNCSMGKTGALLFSVVGGKLSEGLNFSDDLGRCVIVVGLPYGDMRSVEEKARWEYLEQHVEKGAGNANYQANCMKQVNQCIGRAVRHVNDWAAMVLLDERYSQQSVLNQLPAWIRKSLEIHEKFAPAYGSLARFYKKHCHK